jgi:VIT1/CCC1 family predicted Fe2+/Mn2+ transporter
MSIAAPRAVARRSHPTRIPIAPRVEDARADTVALQRKADQVTRGGARAAVLGVNDGLVSNLCLILGLSGASASQGAVRLAGFAALIAGAFSMAAGEWVSVRAQVELYSGVLAELRRLVGRNPYLVLSHLAEKLEEAGMDTATARQASTEMPLDEARFFAFTARTLFGVNSDELGSPLTAAASSFLLFSVGALVPLLPWFFTDGGAAVAWSIALTGLATVVVGAAVSWLSSASLVRGATRQLLIVALASSVTYAVGRLFGTAVA